MKRWIKNGSCNNLEEYFLKNMGVRSLEDVNDWFRRYNANGYTIDGIRSAVVLLKKYKDRPVTIIGDYDTDGATSTAILKMGLIDYGFTDVRVMTLYRFSEGFGINRNMIDKIDDGLILTCDNGIAGIEAIKKAKDKGLAVIVTDHHEPVVEDGRIILPPADIIIDPKAIKGSAVFDGYCGAGIAYKLICELFGNDKRIKDKYIGLAAIGTIGDVMELREENYVIVRRGLEALRSPVNRTRGLYALLYRQGVLPRPTADDIAYKIVPVINALSRLKDDGSVEQIELLTYDGTDEKAVKLADHAIEMNKERKTQSSELYERAVKLLKSNDKEDMNPIMIMLKNANEGVIGITAGKLAEEYRRPAMVFTNVTIDGREYYKGSARGYGDYDVKASFDRHAGLFTVYGGHTGAAGMTILPENFAPLAKALASDMEKASTIITDEALSYDLEIPADKIGDAIKEMARFAPFGEGNPMPTFKISHFRPTPKYGAYRKLLGDSGKMIKINGYGTEAVSFSAAQDILKVPEDAVLDFVGHLGINEYKGNITYQITFLDFAPCA